MKVQYNWIRLSLMLARSTQLLLQKHTFTLLWLGGTGTGKRRGSVGSYSSLKHDLASWLPRSTHFLRTYDFHLRPSLSRWASCPPCSLPSSVTYTHMRIPTAQAHPQLPILICMPKSAKSSGPLYMYLLICVTTMLIPS